MKDILVYNIYIVLTKNWSKYMSAQIDKYGTIYLREL